MKYKVIRTETADAQIIKIILYIAENFGNEVALEKLEKLEQSILNLGNQSSDVYKRQSIFCSFQFRQTASA